MKNTPSKALGASLLAAMLVGGGILQAPPADAAQTRTAASKTCSTGKGKLRATLTSRPNGKTTFHQVWVTEKATLYGNVGFPWKPSPYHYSLLSVKNNAGARVSYMRGARVFSTKKGVRPTVTVRWRAKVPFSPTYQYASCTIK